MRSPSSTVAPAGSPAYASSMPMPRNVVSPAASFSDRLTGTGFSTERMCSSTISGAAAIMIDVS